MGFELLEMNDDLYGLLNEVIRERDELIESLAEARKCAEEMRDLYAAEVDESKKAFPWPWEAQNERG